MESISSDLHSACKDSKEGEGQLHLDCDKLSGYVRLRGCLFLLAADKRGTVKGFAVEGMEQ